MEVYIKKERQEVLAFYLRPDVQTVIGEYEGTLGAFFEKVVGAADSFERDLKRMGQKGYSVGFGETSRLVPDVLVRQDMEMIFDTIVNERVDTVGGPGSSLLTPYRDNALANMAGSLSFEEFKKSLVRVASILTHQTHKVKMEPNEILSEMDQMLETTGGEVTQEWDKFGNPIRYKSVISLRKKPNEATAPTPTSQSTQGRKG